MLHYRDSALPHIIIEWPVTGKSADPNFFFRDWLEKNVGHQEKDWDWCVDSKKMGGDSLRISFKDKKDAIIFLLVKDSLLEA